MSTIADPLLIRCPGLNQANFSSSYYLLGHLFMIYLNKNLQLLNLDQFVEIDERWWAWSNNVIKNILNPFSCFWLLLLLYFLFFYSRISKELLGFISQHLHGHGLGLVASASLLFLHLLIHSSMYTT